MKNHEDWKKVKKIISEMQTPALVNQEEVQCSNCGEDLALESYDWYDEGYRDALLDVLAKLSLHYVS